MGVVSGRARAPRHPRLPADRRPAARALDQRAEHAAQRHAGKGRGERDQHAFAQGRESLGGDQHRRHRQSEAAVDGAHLVAAIGSVEAGAEVVADAARPHQRDQAHAEEGEGDDGDGNAHGGGLAGGDRSIAGTARAGDDLRGSTGLSAARRE